MERVLSLDLSSVCIGVLFCTIDDDWAITKMQTSPIVPSPFSAETLGYLKTKKKVTSGKDMVTAWVKPGETKITKVEKKKRDVEVRSAKDKHLIGEIGSTLGNIFDVLKPTRVLVEKNEIFNGILTSVLLGKIMGALQAVCAIKAIPFEEIRVRHIREDYDIIALTKEYVDYMEKHNITTFNDMTKEAIGHHLKNKYKQFNLKFLTNDESDAVALFDYWYERKKREV